MGAKIQDYENIFAYHKSDKNLYPDVGLQPQELLGII